MRAMVDTAAHAKPLVRSLPVKIAGIGSYLPERRVTNAEIERDLGIPSSWIERATGVLERRRVTNETTSSMAVAAARRALDTAEIDLDEIDVIVGASTAPQQAIPCTAALVQAGLGAPEGRSACFDVNATCLSFLFALQTVAPLVAAGIYRNALIFSSEITSRSLNNAERESAVLFGDAAAAVVLTASGPADASAIHLSRFATYSGGADHTQLLGGGTLHHPNDPSTRPEMNTFHMNGPAIFRQATKLIGPFLDAFLDDVCWQREDIRLVIPHQASRHAVQLVTARLGFRDDQNFVNLPLLGNCIAASIPLALAEAADDGRFTRGDRILLAGSGAGLTLGAVALTY